MSPWMWNMKQEVDQPVNVCWCHDAASSSSRQQITQLYCLKMQQTQAKHSESCCTELHAKDNQSVRPGKQLCLQPVQQASGWLIFVKKKLQRLNTLQFFQPQKWISLKKTQVHMSSVQSAASHSTHNIDHGSQKLSMSATEKKVVKSFHKRDINRDADKKTEQPEQQLDNVQQLCSVWHEQQWLLATITNHQWSALTVPAQQHTAGCVYELYMQMIQQLRKYTSFHFSVSRNSTAETSDNCIYMVPVYWLFMAPHQ